MQARREEQREVARGSSKRRRRDLPWLVLQRGLSPRRRRRSSSASSPRSRRCRCRSTPQSRPRRRRRRLHLLHRSRCPRRPCLVVFCFRGSTRWMTRSDWMTEMRGAARCSQAALSRMHVRLVLRPPPATQQQHSWGARARLGVAPTDLRGLSLAAVRWVPPSSLSPLSSSLPPSSSSSSSRAPSSQGKKRIDDRTENRG